MKISGFSMAKNAGKLYYPLKPAVLSILPIVDEFIIALGDSDPDDNTREEILGIHDEKIKIIDTIWDIDKYPRGTEHAHQTDIAKEHCTGDWLIYLQSDELIHEKDLPLIQQKCKEYLHDPRVEGFLFKYYHFWGDYNHYQDSHVWYRKEIRILRNDPEIHSWESAQSFRRIPDFNGLDYRQQDNTFKLKVIELDAHIYHYGWVRPPELMSSKIKTFNTNHQGKYIVDQMIKMNQFNNYYDYGPLKRVPVFKGSHPAAIKEWIAKFDWQEKLRQGGRISKNKPRSKHSILKYRIISFIEKKLLFGLRLGEFKNYIKIK